MSPIQDPSFSCNVKEVPMPVTTLLPVELVIVPVNCSVFSLK
jgi:hypothetical protein